MNLTCLKCGYEWDYKGKATRNTMCARCHKNVTINSTRKHYALMDLTKHGSRLKGYIDHGNQKLILDILGPNVVEVSEF